MLDASKRREKTEGWLGRRRTYRCRVCHQKFQVDRLNSLPEEERVCRSCREGKVGK
jgi:predicted SprT family Zn-dependent metalloprotease